jgi:hypothetical protein
MKKLVVLAALACALATMPSVPQRAYACPTLNCATDDSTATQVPAATDQTGKATQTACNSSACARPDDTSEPAAKGDRLDRGVQQACQSPNCARPDEDKNPAAVACGSGNCATPEDAKAPAVACASPACATEETKTETACITSNCATPEGDHPARAAASLSPGGAALSKAVRAVKERIRQQRTSCATSGC